MLTSVPGIESTTAILSMAWLLFVAVGSLVLWRSARRYEHPKIAFLFALSLVIGPVLATLTLFPLTHTFVSIPLDQMFNISFWQGDVASGTFALRITSLILTYQLAKAAYRFIPRRIALVGARRARGLSNDHVADFTISVTLEERKLWQRSDLVSLTFFQFAFYLIALTAMWAGTITGLHTLLTVLASWALLFIVDDWAVIADYCYKFDSLPMSWHAAKVLCVNVVLLIAVPAALYPAQLGVIWAVLFLAMVVSGLFVVMFFWRAHHFEVKDA